ncbi:glycoside hydrolase family 140 protein [Emticicia sp.]|uniref:glycoside hydrolase family 140 protein n=1 Tax=Emticicia sp. TaxID=1930953 RepID=UPI00375376D7
MKKSFLFIVLTFLFFQLVSAQTFTVSLNKRYLLKDGKPFMWIGDTAWELFHRLDREEATFYLSKRASQGFTLIQAVALAEMDGLDSPNAYGEKPLINNNPTKPNEAYFKHVDFIIDKAAEYDLVIGLLPTWGDKISKERWGKGPEIFNVENAKIFGKWMGDRYKNRKNIIWILGGDRNPRKETTDTEIWRAMAAGVAEATGGNEKNMMTFHPQPNNEGASEWFHNDDWLDFNMFQTGHCRDASVYDKIKASYDRTPTKPTIDGEPIYEDHPVCFNANEFGTTNAYDVRKSLYLDLFAGAFGCTYGCHDIWQMYSPKHESVNGPHVYWQQALDLPAAKQIKFIKKLMESRPILDRIPDQTLIVDNNLSAYERVQATRGNDYAFIYTALGKPMTVNLGKITGFQLSASWFNPRNGEMKDAGKLENKGTKQFTPPTSGYGQDWVLVLDDASKN